METSIAGNARPTIHFSGPLEDANCIELVDRIRVLRDNLFFSEVQLRIASPGGHLSALRYFAESIHKLQSDGLILATHAITQVGSAAAVMLSLGDVRTAHRKALLLYHTGRVPGIDGTITAQGAESIAAALTSADEEIISLLVARASRAPAPNPATPADMFALGDWSAIRRLSPGNARRPNTLLRALRKRIAEAFRDPSTRMRRLYGDFCALDSPVSPYLALELGLIDAVGDGDLTEKKRSAATDDGGLVVPEWEPLYPGGRVPRYALTRHTMILGETGSGKTASGILPILSAIMRESSPVSCALVIDPKCEIYPHATRIAGADSVRLLRAGVDSVDIMGKSRSVAEDVSKGKWVSAAQKILARAASISDSPARVFAGKRASASVNSYWENEGARLARSILAFTLLISRDGRLSGLLSTDLDMREDQRNQLTDFAKFAGLLAESTEACPVNVLAVAHRAIHDFFLASKASPLSATDVIEALQRAGASDHDELDAIRKDMLYWDRISHANRQYAGVLGEARICFADFADPAAATSMFFGIERRQATVDFAPDVEVDTVSKGRVLYVYQPALGHDEAALIAKGLKGAFFEAVLGSPARRDRGATMPLACYIADEFHRFITSDSSHGEQNFLDTCRSFGTACVLATQSEASIRHALALAREPSPDTAIQILTTNTATKIVFRSTEESVRTLVDGLCPGNGPYRVTSIRPPSSLKPGECYASLPDGRLERRQLEQYVPPRRVIERSATCR